MDGQTSSPFTLYVWPGQWGLSSFDPTCLATVLYLQLTVPGEFSISECNNPDISPTGRWVSVSSQRITSSQLEPFIGQLPFLVHDQFTISSFPSIIKYVAGLKKPGRNDLDAPLTPSERSQKVAWTAHIESHFGNLVVGCNCHHSRTILTGIVCSIILITLVLVTGRKSSIRRS